MRVDEAENGPTGLGRLRAAATTAAPYRVALLDMQMPDMSGLDVAHAVSADATLAAVTMLLLTSWIQPGMTAAAQAAGIVACLPKPVRTQRLLENLVEIIGAAPARPERISRGSMARGVEAPPPMMLGRVLAAEDNTVNKMVIANMLTKLGYEVAVVDDGAQAVEAVAAVPYDAVLMDCRMPVLDGFEAARAIRVAESGTGRRVPIIALTASAMDADREQCLEAGMDAFLTKPIKQRELAEMLERWVRRLTHA
jgi:CheY-like chemotaxis protein